MELITNLIFFLLFVITLVGSVRTNVINANVDYKGFISSYVPTPSFSRQLKEAGIDSVYEYEFYAMLRASVDFVYHAEYYFSDPNDPNKPLRLEQWQKEEIRYAQYGEAILEFNQSGKITSNVESHFNDKGTVKRKPVAINAPRGFGKSIYSSIVAIEYALHFPNTLIALFSTSKDQAQDLMDKVRYFVKHSVFAYMIDSKNNSKTEFGLTNGSKIKAFPQSEVTIRGFQPHIKIVDEKARIKQEILESAIRGMGRKTCFLEIGISTPFGMGNNHYKDCKNENNVFHVKLLKPTEVSWVDLDKLEEECKTMSSNVAKQELYAEFLADSDTVFNPSLLSKFFDPRLTIKDKGNEDRWYILGSDFGKHRDFSSIVIAHQNKQGRIVIDRIEKYGKTDYTLIVDRIVQLCIDFNVKLIVPDGNGVGVSIMEDLKSKLFKAGLKTMIYKSVLKSDKKDKKITELGTKKAEDIRYGFIFTSHSKLNIVDEVLRLLMNNRLICVDHGNTNDKNSELYVYKELEDEMLGFKYTYTASMNVVLSHGTGGDDHDDILMGLCLCCWGFRFLRKLSNRKRDKDKYGGFPELEIGRGGKIPFRTYGAEK